MKKALLVLLLPCVAHAQGAWDISSGTSDFRLLENSVHSTGYGPNLTVISLWEYQDRSVSARWKVVVRGCFDPMGNMTVTAGSMVNAYDWSWDGNRVYDALARNTCAVDAINKLPRKKS